MPSTYKILIKAASNDFCSTLKSLTCTPPSLHLKKNPPFNFQSIYKDVYTNTLLWFIFACCNESILIVATNSDFYYLANIDLANGKSIVIHGFNFFFSQSIDTTQVDDETARNAYVDNKPGDKHISSNGKFQIMFL